MTPEQSKTVKVPCFSPRDYQLPFFSAMDKGLKRAVLVFHRRAGKEIMCWNYMIREAACSRVGTYCYFFPTSRLGRRILWDGSNKEGKRFIDYIPKELVKGQPNSVEMKVELHNGSVIQIMGTDQILNVGINPVGCVFSEYSLQDPRSWDFIRPILRENEGWAVFNFCVAAGTLIFTENGIREISGVCSSREEFTEHVQNLYGLGGYHASEQFYSGGKRKLLKITTNKGYVLSCTPNHQLWDGDQWKRADEWIEGDLIPIQNNQQCWGSGVDLSTWNPPVSKDGRGAMKTLEDPLSDEMFYLMGLYLAEGSMQNPGSARGGAITITNPEEQIIEFLKDFGFSIGPDGMHHYFCGTQLQSFFEWFGLSGTAKYKTLPARLFESTKQQVIQFLRGYFDGDGTCGKRGSGYVKATSVSYELLHRLQVLLLNFGIVCRLSDYHVKPTKKVKVWSHIWNLEIEGYFAYKFLMDIGFSLDRKQGLISKIGLKQREGRGDIVYVDSSKIGYSLPKRVVTNAKRITYRMIERLNEKKASPYLQKIVDDGFYHDVIKTIEYNEADVYDFVIPDTHSFTTNGIISHNTPRGKNHAYDLYMMAKENPDWFCQRLTIEDTGVLTVEDMDAERKEGMSEHLIQQEYYTNFDQGSEGSYYAKYLTKAENDNRVGNVPHDPYALVDTYWDIGVADSTAIIFAQNIGNEIHIIDVYSAEGEGLDHYANILDNKGKENDWKYGRHIAPHDIQVRELGSAGAQTRLQTARNLGINFEICPSLSILEGVELARGIFPRLWINRKKCLYFIKCVENYHKTYNERLNVYSDKPCHDFSSHYADAFRYLAVSQNKRRIGRLSEDDANEMQRMYANRY